jgi:hypothetical protein
MRAARASHWAVPVVSEDGALVARELPDELLWPWEDRSTVVAAECPSYDEDWALILTPDGRLALAGPSRLPIVLDPDEVPPGVGVPDNWSVPAAYKLVD